MSDEKCPKCIELHRQLADVEQAVDRIRAGYVREIRGLRSQLTQARQALAEAIVTRDEALTFARDATAENGVLHKERDKLKEEHQADRQTIKAYFNTASAVPIIAKLVKYPVFEQVMDTPGAAYDFNELCKLAMRLEADAARQSAAGKGEK